MDFENKKILISVIIAIAIVFILYNIFYWNTQLNEDYLYGSWLAVDDDFCEQSEINSMQIFIGPAEKSILKTTRNCYLVVTNDIENTDFTMIYYPNWTLLSVGKYTVAATLEFSDKEEHIFPLQVNITIDIRDGTLSIKDDKTIYALLTKQNDITNLTRDLEDAEMVE